MGVLLALPLLKGIPSWMVRVLAVLLVLALLVGYGWFKGNEHGTAKLNDYMQAQAKESTRITAARVKVTQEVVTRYVKVTKQAEVVERIINNEVVRYETVNTSNCLDARWRVLHDAAAAGSVPDPAGVDGAGDSPKAAAAISTVTDNYAACLANLRKLSALQELLRRQSAVK